MTFYWINLSGLSRHPKKKVLYKEGLVDPKTEFRYFEGAGCDAGGAGVCAGGAGCDFVVPGFTPDRTEPEDAGLLLRRTTKIESVMEVTMNNTADQVVALDRAVAAPRGPKAVWLPMPPNAAAMSPLLPLCNSTTMIRKKHTRM